MDRTPFSASEDSSTSIDSELEIPRGSAGRIGRALIDLTASLHGVGAFGLITLGVFARKLRVASCVIHPIICAQVVRAGVRLLPMVGFIGMALGLVIIGQTMSLLSRVGVTDYAGTIMVTVVVRELGPLIVALLVLARIGATIVIELGTARATGEVEALEALAIDPIHYLVMPRVIGLALSIFALTVYLILVALCAGYLFAFLQNVPLMLGDYFTQLARALRWEDFVLLALKTICFGSCIAIISCYHGLARPLRIQDLATATSRAVIGSVMVCTVMDALFIVVYLIM